MRRAGLLAIVLGVVAACGPRGETSAGAPGSAAPGAAAAPGSAARPGPPGAASTAPGGTAVPPASGAATPSRPPGSLLTRSFSPPALGVAKSYLVWLPAGYDGGSRRYPVVYLLHGLGGNETNWAHHGRVRETADAMGLEAIVVMPDGDDGFYANWAAPRAFDACLADKPPFSPGERPEAYCVKTPRYEDYVAKDLVAHVDATYRTVADAKHRALVGLSMGGFGALSLALRHPDVFGAAASHSGVVALTYAGRHPYVAGAEPLATSLATWGKEYQEPMREHVRRVFGADLANWRAHDPAVLAATLTPRAAPRLYLDCGTEDGFKLQDEAKYLHDVLEKRGVPHRFELVPGPHLFTLWRARLPESLRFCAEGFAAAG